MLRRNAEHVAFLRFVAPQLHRRQRGIIAGHFAQIDDAALVGIVQQFRDGIRQTAGTDIVHEADRVGRTAREAAVDHFLAAPFHFRVVALHRSEIERFRTLPRRHRRGRAAAQTNEHGRTAKHDDDVAVAHRQFLHLARINRAQATGQHDRFVVGAHVRGIAAGQFEAAEVAGQIRSAEFVVECGAAKRAVGHDLEGRGHTRVQRARRFPGLRQGWNAQMRNREAGQPGFWFTATASRAFVADFAAGTGRRAGKRRDGGRVIVGFHLDAKRAGGGIAEAVGAGVIGAQMAGRVAFDHRGIVFVGAQRELRCEFVRVADHAEQAVRHVLAVDAVRGVENLMPAVFGIGLREHHQFGIGRIAAERAVAFLQVRHFILAQRQTEFGIGLRQLGDGHTLQRAAGRGGEQRAGLIKAGAHALGHRIGQQFIDVAPQRIAFRRHAQQIQTQTAFGAAHRQAGALQNFGGLARPRRARPQAGGDDTRDRTGQRFGTTDAAFQNATEGGGIVQRGVGIDEVQVPGAGNRGIRDDLLQAGLEAVASESG